MTPIDLSKHRVTIWAYRPTPHEVWKVRREYKYNRCDIQHRFRSAAQITKRACRGLVYHHQLPIEFGGSNAIENLILMPEQFHNYVHEYIRNINRVIPYGARRYVHVPWFNQMVLRL